MQELPRLHLKSKSYLFAVIHNPLGSVAPRFPGLSTSMRLYLRAEGLKDIAMALEGPVSILH